VTPAPSPEKPSAEQERCPCGRDWPHAKHRTWGCFQPDPVPESEQPYYERCLCEFGRCPLHGESDGRESEHPERRRWTIKAE
jgi:hypothetical protein